MREAVREESWLKKTVLKDLHWFNRRQLSEMNVQAKHTVVFKSTSARYSDSLSFRRLWAMWLLLWLLLHRLCVGQGAGERSVFGGEERKSYCRGVS
jgi:hypothetical protein